MTDAITDIDDPDAQLDALQSKLDRVREEVRKRLVGQDEVLDQLLVCLLCDGNALLESNPGLGKTMTVRTLANVTDLSFSRIQNTPDLMPSDITGTEIIRETETGRDFVFEQGPVFANVVLADEINRATPKTQAALLEAMEEKQVTAAGETHRLPGPFFLLATQNPIEQEGSLHPDETVYMDGCLWRAGDALEHARGEGELVHETDDTRIYDAGVTTQALTPDGDVEETDCSVYEVDYEGEIYTVETKRGRSIRVSGNHPFLVNRAGAVQWVEACDLTEDDHLVAPRRLDADERVLPSHDDALDELASRSEYTVVRRDRVETLVDRLAGGKTLARDELDALRIAARQSKKELAEAVDLSYHQVLDFFQGAENGAGAQLTEALRNHGITVADYVESHTVHRFDDVLGESEAGFFVGFLLAEGCVENGAISVTQKNLPGKLDRWIELAERIGLNVRIRERPTGREANVSSKPFVDYLDARFDLFTPERLLSAPESFRKSFLEIFLLTESHFDTDRRRITFKQKDRTLTNLIAHLLLQFGIVPWIYEKERINELRIQGTDVRRYLDLFEWRGSTPDVEEFDSAHRSTPLSREKVERIVDLLGMKHEGALSDREWYNSYAQLGTERDRMATAYFERFLADAEATVAHREAVDIERATDSDIGEAAKQCGLSMTDVVDGTSLSKHRVWQAYDSDERPTEATEYVAEQYTERLAEAKQLTEHLRGLVDGDVLYDQITSIESEPYEGPVVGLSVPEHHNYVAGLGACGINHNTYPLPEAQADRFLLKILLDYPGRDDEIEIVDRYTTRMNDDPIPVEQVLTRQELREAQQLTREVPIADDIRDHAVDIVRRTRETEDIEYGASPRASMGLVVAGKARALLEGRTYVSEADLEAMARPILRHRIVVDFRAEREGVTPDDAVAELLEEE